MAPPWLSPEVGPARPTDTIRSLASSKRRTSVATTLLAVDDSVTMRKVLEMTFAGEDFRVVTAETPRRPSSAPRRPP